MQFGVCAWSSVLFCNPTGAVRDESGGNAAHLELACAAEPHIVDARQLGDAVAGLVHGDTARIAAD